MFNPLLEALDKKRNTQKVKTQGWFYQAEASWEKCANMSHRQHQLLYFQSSEAQRLAIIRPHSLL